MFGWFVGAILGVVSVIYGLIANILGTITGAFLGVAVSIFNWVISPGFISLSYTNAGLRQGDPNFNSFVSVGWELTRGLTNIIFVIAMVVIGLGTALRYKEYQMQKALPMLILIALLINFTPVLLGLIIDGSNIVMNFFISGGFQGGNSFANFAIRQWSNIGSLVGGLKFWDPTASAEAIAAATGSMILIWFNLISALLYALFAFLFIMRYLAIWILVILSPLAFACYVLPGTRGVWTQWWKNFIQWTLFGVIMSFFLYLGDHFITVATSGSFLQGSAGTPTGAPALAKIIENMLPYLISLALLFIGLIASLAGAPQGAQGIMKGGERAIKQANAISRRWGWQGAKAVGGAAKGAAVGIREGARTYKIERSTGYTSKTGRWIKHSPKSTGQSLKSAIGIGMGNIKLGAGATRPPGDYAKAAGKGLKNAGKDIWASALGRKKKKVTKTKLCPNCHRYVDDDETVCPTPYCGHIF